MQPILEVRELSKFYGKGCPACLDNTGAKSNTNICPDCGTVVAMQRVSFDLYPGEILGIMGESGSGKSTLVKCLYFDQAPTDGKAIFYDSRDKDKAQNMFQLNAAQQRWLRNHRFGMVYQIGRAHV